MVSDFVYVLHACLGEYILDTYCWLSFMSQFTVNPAYAQMIASIDVQCVEVHIQKGTQMCA